VSAQKIADESRQIALVTKSDAQSMKVLALMTTIFLPGTFVSALFSTPMFQRDYNSTSDDTNIEVWKSGWVLYIAVSCPLLLLTLLIWGLWTFGQRLKDEKDIKIAREQLFQSAGSSEKENLALRQNFILQ
jgi:hypothetical protein